MDTANSTVRQVITCSLLAAAGWLRPGYAVAQTSPFQLAAAKFTDGQQQLDYLAPLQALLLARQPLDPSAYEQALATYYSFVGRVASPTPAATRPGPAAFALAAPGTLLPARAQATSVVLINEAHNQPAHRVYCRQLLAQLAPLGYTLFAVEALDPADTAITRRQFPLSTSGYYTSEPNMGKLLRAAVAQGYQVFGHELAESQEHEFADWRRRSNYRDSMQALNILRVLRQHPQAKLLALVGYDHVLEKERDGLKRLGAYLRELGGIDPLTIDQTQAYRPAAGPAPTQPTVLVRGQDGPPATMGSNTGYVDMQVVHPVATQRQGRPSWLFAAVGAAPQVIAIPARYRAGAHLVQLFDAQEHRQYGRRAIPLDQCLTRAGQRQVTLFAYEPGRPVTVVYQLANLP